MDLPKTSSPTLLKVPHYGIYIKDCLKEIMDEEFHPYVTEEGEELPQVLISESEKWMKIAGKYYPVDLICGYNQRLSELYTIDGKTLKLHFRARSYKYKAAIKAFFEDRGYYYKTNSYRAYAIFENITKGANGDLSKADFGKLRYTWEKNLSDDDYKHRDFFRGVYADRDIKGVVKDIKKKKVVLEDYLNFSDYKNEYSVCNGIRLLRKLGFPMKNRGIDFLFDCLNDIDEPYFMMATEELMTFNSDVLKEKLEERAPKAYEEQDVLKMAGLLYLAKKLDYEIKFLADIRNEGKEDEAVIKAFEYEDSYQGKAVQFLSSET